ncbi:hypothetical protein GWR56_18930 [Mucilaginibacter sp. 14171R-50]|uniref:hypothetical protein n=1 Tax=Mucilaginibacter sp. 14171R-50 TaxID=2703789 RepID=UPI00138DB485|nr:hypothetical protein [Mucilaginibacter sp. 14171R-50]QHS57519.1 hypothetical protein GWR56_18930 [Mucilaginibacter sp. 14171R-50]
MKKVLVISAIAVSAILSGCKGNPQGAIGANDKPDSTVYEKQNAPRERPEASKNDTSKNVGPGSDKNQVTDSESKDKHR